MAAVTAAVESAAVAANKLLYIVNAAITICVTSNWMLSLLLSDSLGTTKASCVYPWDPAVMLVVFKWWVYAS